MDTTTLPLDEAVRQYENQSFKNAIQDISDGGIKEITIAVHPAFNLLNSQIPIEAKEMCLKNTKNYLQFCKENGVKILHFRDMWPRNVVLIHNLYSTMSYIVLNEEIEPSLFNKFDVKADYEIPTFPNIGVPLDLADQYFEQEAIYGIFSPVFYIRENKIQVVNGIGAFTEPNACFPHGLSIMERIALKEVRVIKECVIQKTTQLFNLGDYSHPAGRVLMYSFKGRKLEKC